jgi:type II secretory pathway predicted ATPase ExeA
MILRAQKMLAGRKRKTKIRKNGERSVIAIVIPPITIKLAIAGEKRDQALEPRI